MWNVERAVKYGGVRNQKLRYFFQKYAPKQNMPLNTAVFHKWKSEELQHLNIVEKG